MTTNKRKIQLLYYFSPLVLFSYLNLISVKTLSSMHFHLCARDHRHTPRLGVKTCTAPWMTSSHCDLGDGHLSPGCCPEVGAVGRGLHINSVASKINQSCEVLSVGGTRHQTKKGEYTGCRWDSWQLQAHLIFRFWVKQNEKCNLTKTLLYMLICNLKNPVC